MRILRVRIPHTGFKTYQLWRWIGPLLCLYCSFVSSVGFRLLLLCNVCMPGLAPLRPALPRAHDGPGSRPQRRPRHRQAGEAHLHPQTDDNDCRKDVQGERQINFFALLHRGLRVWISFGLLLVRIRIGTKVKIQ
jgi:hypothetical protein